MLLPSLGKSGDGKADGKFIRDGPSRQVVAGRQPEAAQEVVEGVRRPKAAPNSNYEV